MEIKVEHCASALPTQYGEQKIMATILSCSQESLKQRGRILQQEGASLERKED